MKYTVRKPAQKTSIQAKQLRKKLHLLTYLFHTVTARKIQQRLKAVRDYHTLHTPQLIDSLSHYWQAYHQYLNSKLNELRKKTLRSVKVYTQLSADKISPTYHHQSVKVQAGLRLIYFRGNLRYTLKQILKRQRHQFLGIIWILSNIVRLLPQQPVAVRLKRNSKRTVSQQSLFQTAKRSSYATIVTDILRKNPVTPAMLASLSNWDVKLWHFLTDPIYNSAVYTSWRAQLSNSSKTASAHSSANVLKKSASRPNFILVYLAQSWTAIDHALSYEVPLPKLSIPRFKIQLRKRQTPTDSTPAKVSPSIVQVTPPFSDHPILGRLVYPFWYTVYHYPKTSAFCLILSIIMLTGTYTVHELIFKDLPSPTQLSEDELTVSTKILDRHGNLLYSIYQDENRTLIPLSEVPDYTIKATIAIEDQDFYNHHGFSVKGIFRAVVSNLQGNSVQGGSTLTQQLIKNKLLSSERTFTRKIKEVLLAILAEGIYSKQQILEMYFNQIAYGGAAYGIEEASQKYFGKHTRELTLAESALLAGIPAAPSAYSPFGPHPELAVVRQHEVLRRMVEEGYITEAEAQQAAAEQLSFEQDRIDIQAPHFVMYVRQLLAERYGEEVLTRGGLIVRTSLDLPLQENSQKIITDEVTSLQRLRITNGAGLITNPQTGEVLAMVGSINYFDFQHDGQVNVTLMPRQPGSSIKPLTYAMALERGRTPSTLIDDAPISFNIAGSKPYTPQNYDGSFHGKVSLRESLASSYNIPAVKLLNEIGLNNFIDQAERMGITTWTDRKRFGLSLTLGGGEVKMVDLATAYSAFANQGKVTDLNPILEIKNYKGEQLYLNTCALENKNCKRRQVLSPLTAFLISDILSDNKARTPTFGPISNLYIPNQEVAVKTGTTNNLRDNWTFGYTTDRLVSVWVGNNNNAPMSYVASGITGASPIWNKMMTSLLDKNNPHAFGPPEGIEKVAICTVTGTRTCQGCPSVKEEFFIAGTAPTQACNPDVFRKQPAIARQDSSKPTPMPNPGNSNR